MSVHHLSWALEQKTRSPLHKLILVLQGNRCDQDGRFVGSIADACCCTPGEYNAALLDLISDGLIEVDDGWRLAAPPEYTGWREVPWAPTPAFRKRILDRDGHRCVACGATERLCIDHIIPRAKGGTNDDDNLQVLCAPCNTSKGRKMPGEWKGRTTCS